jgi:hypothetical protein
MVAVVEEAFFGNYQIVDLSTYETIVPEYNENKKLSTESYGSLKARWSNVDVRNHYATIKYRAELTAYGGLFHMPQASKALRHFLKNTGNPYDIDFDKMINQAPSAYWLMVENLNELMYAAEEFLSDSSTIQSIDIGTVLPEFAHVTPDNNTGVYEGKFGYLKRTYSIPTPENLTPPGDWFYAVGNLDSWITATVNRQGDIFTADINYHIKDYYRWDPDPGNDKRGGLVLDNEMAELHKVGLAREYPQYGTTTFNLEWKNGERMKGNYLTGLLENSLIKLE